MKTLLLLLTVNSPVVHMDVGQGIAQWDATDVHRNQTTGAMRFDVPVGDHVFVRGGFAGSRAREGRWTGDSKDVTLALGWKSEAFEVALGQGIAEAHSDAPDDCTSCGPMSEVYDHRTYGGTFPTIGLRAGRTDSLYVTANWADVYDNSENISVGVGLGLGGGWRIWSGMTGNLLSVRPDQDNGCCVTFLPGWRTELDVPLSDRVTIRPSLAGFTTFEERWVSWGLGVSIAPDGGSTSRR